MRIKLLIIFILCFCVVAAIISYSEKLAKQQWIKVGEDPLGEVFYDRNSVIWHPITPTYGVYSVWVKRTYIPDAINDLQSEGPGMRYSLLKYRFDCVLQKYTKVQFKYMNEKDQPCDDSGMPRDNGRPFSFEEIPLDELDTRYYKLTPYDNFRQTISNEICKIPPDKTLRPYEPLTWRGERQPNDNE
jgi:hypothetical protein